MDGPLLSLLAPAVLAVPLGLASWAALNVWFQGDIFVPLRKTIRAKWGGLPLTHPLGFLAALLGCRFCMAVHVPFWPLIVAKWASWGFLDGSGVVLASLAATGVVQIMDELLKDISTSNALDD